VIREAENNDDEEVSSTMDIEEIDRLARDYDEEEEEESLIPVNRHEADGGQHQDQGDDGQDLDDEDLEQSDGENNEEYED